MKPLKFPEHNAVYGANQKEKYLPLPAYMNKKDPNGQIITCWKLTLIDQIRVLITGRVWVSVLTFQDPLQPLHMTAKKSDYFKQPVKQIFSQILRKLKIMRVFLFLALLILASCAINPPHKSARQIWNCSSTYQELGRYDTSMTIKENFFKGTTTIVHLQDDSCIVIWGKKCDFDPGELLFAKGEYWGSIGHCKYFLINEAKTRRYSLLERK